MKAAVLALLARYHEDDEIIFVGPQGERYTDVTPHGRILAAWPITRELRLVVEQEGGDE